MLYASKLRQSLKVLIVVGDLEIVELCTGKDQESSGRDPPWH